jgi:hypothetical protein
MESKFYLLIAAVLLGLFSPVLTTAVMAAGAWGAAYFYDDTYAAFCSYFGWPFEAWQTGALIGFASGMLSSFGLKLKGG